MEVQISAADRIMIISTFAIYTFGLLLVAVYSGRIMARTPVAKYVSEFYTAGRGLGTVIVGLLVASSICSSGTFVGGPGLAYSTGLSWSLNSYSFWFTNLTILGAIGIKLGIVGRRIDAQTYLDVLEARYNKNRLVTLLGVAGIVLFLAAYCSAQFIGGARMLEVVTGLPYSYGLALYAVVVILYSSLGGLRGVSIAALLQGVAMTVCAVLLFTGALIRIGGFQNAFMNLEAVNPKLATPFGLSFAYQMSMWVTFGLVYIAMPHGTLGCLAYKDTRAMYKAIVIGAVVVPMWAMFMNWSGWLARSVYPALKIADHANPSLAVTVLHPVLAGVVIAGAASAAQSTIATMVLAVSGTLVRNLYQKLIRPQSTARELRSVAMLATAAVGVSTFLLALDPPKQLEHIVIYAIGGLASAFFWPMLLGLYWTRANEWGAAMGMVSGMVTYILAKSYVKALAMGVDPIVVGLLVSGVFTVAVSLWTPAPPIRILQMFWGADRVED